MSVICTEDTDVRANKKAAGAALFNTVYFI